MLRMMCKECANADRDYYINRKKTGEVIVTERIGGRTNKIVRCTACGHTWHYSGRRRK